MQTSCQWQLLTRATALTPATMVTMLSFISFLGMRRTKHVVLHERPSPIPLCKSVSRMRQEVQTSSSEPIWWVIMSQTPNLYVYSEFLWLKAHFSFPANDEKLRINLLRKKVTVSIERHCTYGRWWWRKVFVSSNRRVSKTILQRLTKIRKTFCSK